MVKKKKTTAIALLLIAAFVISCFALPATNAQSSKKTYAFIGVAPNPIGKGQQAAIHVGIPDALQTATDGWNVSIKITKPDGKIDTLGPYKTDSTGGTGVGYVPDQIGTYKLQTIFPG